jgi:hypothetical protein
LYIAHRDQIDEFLEEYYKRINELEEEIDFDNKINT